MNEFLSNTELFEELRSDPTSYLELKHNRLIKLLFDTENSSNQFITVSQKKFLTNYTSIPPRIYGQIKIHKENKPIRPIVSTIKSVAYNLSRFLATILRKSFKPKYSIKNSKEFVKNVIKIKIPENYKYVSFDVVNCFTNISTEIALNIIKRDFNQYISKNTNIPKELFIDLLNFCLNECNYFCYEEKIIRMKTGLFMGSSLAPILVERVLEDVVEQTLIDLDFSPLFWYSYVDDHITAIPENKIQTILNKLNNYDEKIKFTVEVEENGKINYLDTTIYRKTNGKTITNWYHKDIASNRIINYYSAHPHHMKINTVKNFITKVFCLSHKEFWTGNLKRIKTILTKNNYPENVIKKLINSVRQRVKNKNNNSNENSNSYAYLSTDEGNTSTYNKEPSSITNYASMTYVPSLTEKLSKACKYFTPNVHLAMKPPIKASNKQFFKNLKSQLQIGQKSDVVYKINCKNCNVVYIGETTQKLTKRMKQHQYDCKTIKQQANISALAKHARSNKHEFDFENTKILKIEQNKIKLQIHEVNQIIKYEQVACNYKSDKKDYTNSYCNLITPLN